MVTFETVMEIKILHKQGMSSRAIARELGSPAIAKWHLNRSRFGIRIDHDLASQSITIWHASDH